MAMNNFVVYLRVSTGRQEISGLGTAAQREAVVRYAAQTAGTLIAEFVEVESGAKSNRPQLAKALALCRKAKATLLIARLDRLSRSLSFVAQLLDANVEIKCCDMPDANRLLLQMLAVFAEHERQMIRERTRAALAAAKARGVVLGKNGAVLAVQNRKSAMDFAETLRPHVNAARESGVRTLTGIGDYLTAKGVRTSSGGKWHPSTVQRLLHRLEGDEAA
jgi:DNA invertase Pin-like site-specific DNA recombinase